MRLDWLSGLIVQYGLVAAAMLTCASLFLIFKKKVETLGRKIAKTSDEVGVRLLEMESSIRQFGEQAAAAGPPPAIGIRPAMNLTRRAQALRMRHRGESAETIAAALESPRNEVELLLKIHEKLSSRPA